MQTHLSFYCVLTPPVALFRIILYVISLTTGICSLTDSQLIEEMLSGVRLYDIRLTLSQAQSYIV